MATSKVKAQPPAIGIMQNADYEDVKSFTILCDCHSPEHQVHMWIEVGGNEEYNQVEVNFFVNTTTPFWKKGFSRVKAAWDILTKGYREEEHTLILNEQSAINMAEAIKASIKVIK